MWSGMKRKGPDERSGRWRGVVGGGEGGEGGGGGKRWKDKGGVSVLRLIQEYEPLHRPYMRC